MKFKKILYVIFLIFIVESFYLAPVQAIDKDLRTVRVSIHELWPTVFFDKEGTPKGLLVDILNVIASEENWKLIYVMDEWSVGLERLKNKEVDLKLSIVYSQERDIIYDFSEEPAYLDWGTVVVHDPDIKNILSINKRKVGITRKGFFQEEFKKLCGNFNISPDFVIFESDKDILMAVKNKQVDAGVIPHVFGILNLSEFDVKESPIIFAPVEVLFATSEGQNRDLLESIDQHLKQWKQDSNSIYYEILDKWFYSEKTIRVLPHWLIVSVIICVGLLTILFVWSRMLQHKVNQRTEDLTNSNNKIQKKINELKQSEEKLQRSRARLKLVLDTVPQFVFWKDIEGCYIGCNRVFASAAGVDNPDQILGKTDFDLPWPKKEAESYREDDREVIESNCPKLHIIEQLQKADGTRIWVDTSKAPLCDANGYPFAVLGVLEDITERKQAEDELRESEERFRAIFERSTIGKSLTLPDGKLHKVNQAFCDLLGYSVEEMHQLNFADITHPDDIAKSRECIRSLLSNEQNSYRMEKRYTHKNGDVVWTDVNTTLLKDKNNKNLYFITSVSDITERKWAENEKEKLESRLQQAQKMESIGNLAGGIAHDFNNILFPIVGQAEMLLEDLPPDSPEHESVYQIFTAGKRGSDLVKQILAFSRQNEHKMIPVRIQQVLKEVLKLSRSTIPTDIEITQDISSDCGLVLADPTQIHQIAMNLITNAYHAIENIDGKIDVRVKETTLEGNEWKDSHLQSGQYILLSVSDNGCGIPGAILHKIFEPYFTTKGQGKGTGLGLAVVFGIVKEHKGDIKVYSEVEKGTTFNVYLPLMQKTEHEASTDKIEIIQTGTERILLVDDEEPIARLERQMLERLGYKVTEQSSSFDALKVFKANPDAFDLVITDMNMPNMTGDQLANELLSIRPDILVIICTGFSERINKEKAEASGIRGFLMKPVVKYNMAQMVRKVLDEAKIS